MRRASDVESTRRLFGTSEELLPLWMAEPYVPLAPGVVAAIQDRAADAWFGYEVRPADLMDVFWRWMKRRHGWSQTAMKTSASPSVGTSISSLIEILTDPGDGVILQPPVFTDFKPLIQRAGRETVRNPLQLAGGRYTMDLDNLASRAESPGTKVMILCNPHNPVGRTWSPEELGAVASICAEHGVFVIADEIHADLALPPHRFTPFGTVARSSGVRWAAAHGPIKTFGLAGVCDTLLITDDEQVSEQFRAMTRRLHLARNNVFSIAAMHAGYSAGDEWVDGLVELVATNTERLRSGLPDGVRLVQPEGTYLAWLDFRGLDMDVPELSHWLVESAHLALSPGHWFGREGAGFARMTVAVGADVIDDATARIRRAVQELA